MKLIIKNEEIEMKKVISWIGNTLKSLVKLLCGITAIALLSVVEVLLYISVGMDFLGVIRNILNTTETLLKAKNIS